MSFRDTLFMYFMYISSFDIDSMSFAIWINIKAGHRNITLYKIYQMMILMQSAVCLHGYGDDELHQESNFKFKKMIAAMCQFC